MKISAMYIENLICSLLLDNGIGCEAYKSQSWDDYFKLVSPIREGNNASKPNTQNLSVWRDGRGSFSDYEVDGYFIDFKGCSSQPKLDGKKSELWAGRPSGQKSANHSWENMSAEEIKQTVIKEYHDHKTSLQIHASLTDNAKPYIIGFVWPVVGQDGKVQPQVQLVNITKLWASAGVSDNAIKRRFFILRTKTVNNKYAGTLISQSHCARIEVKFKKEGAFAHLASIGAITKPHAWNEVQAQLKTII